MKEKTARPMTKPEMTERIHQAKELLEAHLVKADAAGISQAGVLQALVFLRQIPDFKIETPHV